MPYPYSTSKQGLIAAINQLRSAFPNVVNSDTLKKWSIAPNNEGPVLNALRFIGIIDEEGKKQLEAAKVFNEHDDIAFAEKFKSLVELSYTGLFEFWGDKTWTLDKEKLITFFRNVDGTSARVGQEQAVTFLIFASFAGYGKPVQESKSVVPANKGVSKANKGTNTNKNSNEGTNNDGLANLTSSDSSSGTTPSVQQKQSSVPALTVRIEINLPIGVAIFDWRILDRQIYLKQLNLTI